MPVYLFLFISGGRERWRELSVSSSQKCVCVSVCICVYVLVCLCFFAWRDITRKKSPNKKTSVVLSKYQVILHSVEDKRAVQHPFHIGL